MLKDISLNNKKDMQNFKNTIKFIPILFLAIFLFAGDKSAEAACWSDSGPAWMNCDLQNDNDNNNDNDNDNDSDNLEVSTNSATSVDEDSATLRGEITDLDESEDYDRWFEWGTDDDDLDNTENISGTTDDEGSFSESIGGLSDDRTYYFRACAESNDSNDEDCGSIRSFTTDEEDNNNDDDNDNDDNDDNDSDNDGGVVTTDATGITTSSAILNGVVVNDGGNQRVWFAWGTTTYLGNSTASRTVSGDQNLVSIQIGGLSPNQSYFFRLMSDTGEMGDMKALMTKSVTYVPPTGTTPTPTTKPPVTVVTSSQFLNVDLVANIKEAGNGDTVLYAAVYENLSNTAIKNLSVTIDFPEGISPVKSDAGKITGQKVTLFLPALGAKGKGDFTIEASISGDARNEKFLVSVIEGSYEHPTDEDTMITTLDYSIVKVLRGGNSQSATALFAGGFFPNTFLGWLIIIAIIATVIILASIASKKKKEDKKDELKEINKEEKFELKISK